ncbi:MAG: hypothetical protein AVDCRST_MAG39-461, partial [uncultured Sphingomonadaceae bacterium]
ARRPEPRRPAGGGGDGAQRPRRVGRRARRGGGRLFRQALRLGAAVLPRPLAAQPQRDARQPAPRRHRGGGGRAITSRAPEIAILRARLGGRLDESRRLEQGL